MVQLVILAHELSPLEEGKPDQYTGFPIGVKNKGWGDGGSSKCDGGGGGGGVTKKGKINF